MKSGTFNVLKTSPTVAGSIGHRFHVPRNQRLMLGMSVDKATAETWLATYRAKYPQFTFALVDDAPPTTCEIPVLHGTVQ